MNADDPQNGDRFERTLTRVLASTADSIDPAGFNADEVRQLSRARRGRQRLVAVAAALVAVAAVGVAVVATGSGDQEQVRAGDPTSTAQTEMPCLRPGVDNTIGYIHLRGDQVSALLEIDISDPDNGSVSISEEDLALLSGREPALLTADQYQMLADSDLPITAAQVAQMGYNLAQGGPATTAPTTTTAPPPTSTLPEGVTPFEAWADALRTRGLLTPEQEADIAAGLGLSLTEEQGQVINEVFPTPTPTPNGPVAEKAGFSPDSEPGPPICPTN